MDEDDAVAFPLLRVGRRDKEGNPQPGNAEGNRGSPEPRDQAPGMWASTAPAPKISAGM